MLKVDINTLVNVNNYLNKNIPNNIIIVGKIDIFIIKYKYDKLDLSRIECDVIEYHDQEGNSCRDLRKQI